MVQLTVGKVWENISKAVIFHNPDFTLTKHQQPVSLSLPQPAVGQGGDQPAWVLNFTRNDLSSQGHHGEKTRALVSCYKHLASDLVQNQLLRCPWEQCLRTPLAKKQFFTMNQNLCAGCLKPVPWKKGKGVSHQRQRLKSRVWAVSGKCTKVSSPAEMCVPVVILHCAEFWLRVNNDPNVWKARMGDFGMMTDAL